MPKGKWVKRGERKTGGQSPAANMRRFQMSDISGGDNDILDPFEKTAHLPPLSIAHARRPLCVSLSLSLSLTRSSSPPAAHADEGEDEMSLLIGGGVLSAVPDEELETDEIPLPHGRRAMLLKQNAPRSARVRPEEAPRIVSDNCIRTVLMETLQESRFPSHLSPLPSTSTSTTAPSPCSILPPLTFLCPSLASASFPHPRHSASPHVDMSICR